MKTNELDDRRKSDWEGMQQQRDQQIIRESRQRKMMKKK